MQSNKSTAIKIGLCLLAGCSVLMWGSSIDVPVKGLFIFSVFIAVIFSFILKVFPMGMMVLVGLLILLITKTLTIKESLSGFADSTVWLVVAAFILARAMINTGLGKRIALLLVSNLGKTVKGLAYAICTSEFILATVMPSNTARGGGIHAPIVDSLSRSLGSTNLKFPEKAGSYLSLVGSHANLIAASMFMTGMAANPLVSKAVEAVFGIEFGWGTWALGAIVPGVLSLLFLPQLMHLLVRPTLTDGKAAQVQAKKELKAMGPTTLHEKVMLAVLVMLVLLWATKFLHGLGTTTVAIIGVAILLLSKTQTWEQVIKNEKAWDTLIWLGGLLTMANMLLEYGFIEWFVGIIKNSMLGISGLTAIIMLGIIYFYSMYFFSMLTAHIASMAAPFLAVCLAVSGQPLVAAAVFAYFSCLCGCTTNYSSGPVIIYFGLGYVEAPKWFKIGFIISLFHLVVWLGSGILWWKVLGWW